MAWLFANQESLLHVLGAIVSLEFGFVLSEVFRAE